VSLSGNGINLADFVSHGSQKRRNICGVGDIFFLLCTTHSNCLLASGLVTITQGLRIVVKENNISSLYKNCVRIQSRLKGSIRVAKKSAFLLCIGG
jgi:hypothetical protein